MIAWEEWELNPVLAQPVTGLVINMESADPVLSPFDLPDWWDSGVRVIGPPTPLRRVTNGAGEVQARGKDVAEVIDDLDRQFPGLRERLVEETGELRRFVNIYVNQEDVRVLSGKETTLKEGDEISIVPAIAGGD